MEFKQLKAELEIIFAKITSELDNNNVPDIVTLQEFVRLARIMPMLADDSWIGESEDFSHLATQLLQSARNKDFRTAILLADALNDAQLFCHKSFRN
ncbi:GAK system XXXCH domain-containing protein [Desulfonatronovibrio hydrogenovorans]|uniref:GAK system XXXCH domain-containing protein n=1 Tax=Desulfonatronovibrio hydrogenovorans TaxID=53245 RepID=UPI000491B237|nr:GAK system XXXCH domain-containing protein [Desulfonatronovibrio hydrogenovorans]